MSESLHDLRLEFQQHPENFRLIRGRDLCSFCAQFRVGYQHKNTFICTTCLNPPLADPVSEELEAPEGELVHVPFTQGIKKMKMTVMTSPTSWEEDFRFVEDSEIQKLHTGRTVTVIRRNYFYARNHCLRISVAIKNLEASPLKFTVAHVTQDLLVNWIEEKSLKGGEVLNLDMTRDLGEDRESYKFSDESGKLVMILSFQEGFPFHDADQAFATKKKPRTGGLAGGHVTAYRQPTPLDISLRNLCLLGQDG